MNKLKESRLFFWTIELLAFATLIFVSTKIGFLFEPIGTFVSTLFAPVLVAGFLYYIMNPLIKFLENRLKIKRIWGILLVFIVLIVLFVLLVVNLIPNLLEQLTQLIQNFPAMMKEGQKQFNLLVERPELKNIDLQKYLNELNLSTSKFITGAFSGVTDSLLSIVGIVSSVTIVVITVPIVLFYMFKDGEKFPKAVQRFVPLKYKEEVGSLLTDVDHTLSSFISGQAIVCLYVAVCTSLGYWAIGLPYALLLGVIAGAMDIIPYLGPWLGVTPAILIAFTRSPFEALLVAIIVIVTQVGESNIVYPLVMGKSLDMHPLTIVFILLVAGNLAGLIGMILGIPLYAVLKIVLHHLYGMIDDRREIPLNREEIDEV